MPHHMGEGTPLRPAAAAAPQCFGSDEHGCGRGISIYLRFGRHVGMGMGIDKGPFPSIPVVIMLLFVVLQSTCSHASVITQLTNESPYQGALTGGAVNTPCSASFKYSPSPGDTILSVQAIADINPAAQMTLWGDSTIQNPSWNNSEYKGIGMEFTREIVISPSNGTLSPTYYFTVEGGCLNTTYSITAHSRPKGPVPGGSGFVSVLNDPYNGIILGFVMAKSSVQPCDQVLYDLYARSLEPDDAPSLVQANMTTFSGLNTYATKLDVDVVIVDSGCGYVEIAVGHYAYDLYSLVARDAEDSGADGAAVYLVGLNLNDDPAIPTQYAEILVLMYVWIPILICCCVALFCSVMRSRREDEWVDEDDLLRSSFTEETPLGGHVGTGAPEHDPNDTELLPIRRNKRKKKNKGKKKGPSGTSAYGAVPDTAADLQV